MDSHRSRANTPDRIGPYEILGELGGGGMATVYLGRTSGIAGWHRLFAVKRIHEHLSREDAFVKMFLNEAAIAARIHHPGIVSVFDVGQDEDGRVYIAMEYLRGETLSFVLNRAWKGGPGIPYHVMAYLVSTACDALHMAHELRDDYGDLLGVIHRDLSPRNMMLGYDGFLRILDFGVAKAQNKMVPRTRTGTQKGTVAYMAPEQILGRKLDRRLDIFALGVVLWEASVGKRLFASSNDFATAAKVRQAQVPPPTSLREGYPAGLEKVVLQALRREPDDRFQTAREFGDSLRVFLATSPQLIGPTDVADMVHRLCSDRYKQRLDMEGANLTRLDKDPLDDPSSGSISLNVSVAIPPVSTEGADRERTQRTGSNPELTTKSQPYRDLGGDEEPLTNQDEEPRTEHTRSNLYSDPLADAPSTKRDSIERILSSPSGVGDPTRDSEPATDHLGSDVGSGVRNYTSTLEEGTEESRRSLQRLLDAGVTDSDAEIDLSGLETGEEREGIRLDEHFGSTDETIEAPEDSTQDERVDLLGASQPTYDDDGSEEDTRGVLEAIEVDVDDDPMRLLDELSLESTEGVLGADGETPLRPEDLLSDSARSLEELDPSFLQSLDGPIPSESQVDMSANDPAEPLQLEPAMQLAAEMELAPPAPAPPIDDALAALADSSQLDMANPLLEAPAPKIDLDEDVAAPRRSSSRPAQAPARSATAVVYRDRGDPTQERVALMSSELADETLPPLSGSPTVEHGRGGRRLQFAIFGLLIVLLAGVAVFQIPEVRKRAQTMIAELSDDAAPARPAEAAAVEAPSPTPAAAKAPAAVPQAAPPAEAPKPKAMPGPKVMTKISFVIAPPEASILVDGDPVRGDLVVPTSTKSLMVEVAAPGYLPQSRTLVADRDQKLEFSLKAKKKPRRRRRR